MQKVQRKQYGYGLVLGLVLTGGWTAGGGPALGQTGSGNENGQQPRISVWVYNYAQVADQTLERGEKEAARIFRDIGVEVSWGNCNPTATDIHVDASCTPQIGPLNLGLRILPAFAIVQGVTDDKTLGLAFGNFASVSFRWVREEAAVVGSAPSELLGLAIAHEIGHLLLVSEEHSRSGIMRARWSREDFQRAPLGTFSFAPEQAQAIRTEIRKRVQSQTAEASITPVSK